MDQNHMAGHAFLASLGKTRLRPGGKKATDWLMDKAGFTPDTRVLEVACNMGTTTVEIASTWGCRIDAMDLDDKALKKAEENIRTHHLEDRVTLHQGNAMSLPFEDNTFDVIINEAMLTMIPPEGKVKCVTEYFRVLKPGGLLLTHDVMLKGNPEDMREELSKTIHVPVTPLTPDGWKGLMEDRGFSPVEVLTGDMSLMSLDSMVYDEGWQNTLKILTNAMKPENFPRFQQMYNTFGKNKNKLGFIAMASHKPR